MTADPGYGVFEGVFTESELAPAIDALEGGLATRSRAGARHVLAVPEVRALAEDPRMLRLADRFVAGARPFRATLFDKSAATNWLARDIVPVSCTVGAGGVAMRPLLLHASSKSRSDARRRVLHVEYAAATNFGPGLDLRVG